MSIPKIIWAIWCNFTKKENGELTDQLIYFKDRIIQQHPEWQVNIITEWDILIGYINENPLLLDLINNPIVIAAHKSDLIRFFLLNKFGGFWIDLSTFLFTSLNIYYEKQPNAKFICYYTPPFMVEEILFSSLNEMFDSIKFNEIVQKFKPKQNRYIDLNDEYKNYQFIPENFFIACTPGHPIVDSIFNQMTTFWEATLPYIENKQTLCYHINLLMKQLGGEVFLINNLDYDLTKTYSSNDITNKEFLYHSLDNVWHCGYVFNYLQMYIAIVNYIKAQNLTITQETNQNELTNQYTGDLCSIDGNINACKNIIATDESDGSTLYLLSLSYNRLIKWANTMDDRISFDNTYISNLVDNIGKTQGLTKEKLIQDMVNMGIYQIKFSSWTRKSDIISKFMAIYPNNEMLPPIQTAGKTKKRKIKKTKNKKNKNQKTKKQKTKNKKLKTKNKKLKTKSKNN